ncbi:hypothetical protein PAN31108_01428 [Pandoraea anhela]|uniref:Uncharacterized protein n=1 Tax=Pandoraea anhela TaxID=2508295 RepID=A0A5E4TFZ8_9BURK|nr:hypothetical protein PAN31108_01428 [Pandoraea anhela]
MVWHVYEFEKTDSSFLGMFGLNEWKERLGVDSGQAAVELIDAELADALDSAREAGWRGEVQGEPHIFVLPAEQDFQFGFAWNGAGTTVLAPRALPWMTPKHVAPS